MLNTLDRLVAVEEIKQLKARYFRALDTKDWADLGSVFAPDAVFDLRFVNSVKHPITGDWIPAIGGEEAVFTGNGPIVAMIRSAIEGLYTIHHGHMPEIEILSESTARAVWPMEDVLRHASGQLLLTGSGHYHETYAKSGAAWQIKTSRLTRLFISGALALPEMSES